MRKIARHLTYANAMSTLAVFLILGGAGALAATKQAKKIGTTQLKASAVTTNKIKNGAVTNPKLAAVAVSTDKLADASVTNPKLADGAVTNAKLAGDAVTGDKVNEATLGEVPSANSANPGVFARVGPNPVVDAANSKGLTSLNVSSAGSGVYCIAVPAFTPRGGQVSAERNAGAPVSASLTLAGPSCAAPKVQVETFVAGVATNNTFYVELYR